MDKTPLTLDDWIKEILNPVIDKLTIYQKAKGKIWNEEFGEWVKDGVDEVEANNTRNEKK